MDEWQDVEVFESALHVDGNGQATSRRPSSVRGPSARAYLLIVLGEYALNHGGAAWTQTVVDTLALAGFEAKAARQALTRTAAEGLLVSQRVGRRTRWEVTPAGHDFLIAAKNRLFAAGPETDWNGDWLILLTSVPENHRNLRHRLRAALSWAGFGSPVPGVWLSPHPTRATEARQALGSVGEPVQATLLHARLDDAEERHRLVGQAWDVAALDEDYSAFVDHFATATPASPGETLAQLAHLVYRWRRLLLADPGLPPTLLPAGWSGEQARELLLDLHRRWHPTALTWWRDREATHAR
ncbi:PaaX family transcriptional regulator C-terminal domain-containing protein [Actinophytocola sp.]|uniref:PaaX family transcriptional regulator n=1 Tax=Actinophytocola sp. TaxID=1872138 RepID=UPI002ED43659